MSGEGKGVKTKCFTLRLMACVVKSSNDFSMSNNYQVLPSIDWVWVRIITTLFVFKKAILVFVPKRCVHNPRAIALLSAGHMYLRVVIARHPSVAVAILLVYFHIPVDGIDRALDIIHTFLEIWGKNGGKHLVNLWLSLLSGKSLLFSNHFYLIEVKNFLNKSQEFFNKSEE